MKNLSLFKALGIHRKYAMLTAISVAVLVSTPIACFAQEADQSFSVNGTDTTATRGVSFAEFRYSVKEFRDSSKKVLALTAWQLWKDKKWKDLEQLFNKQDLGSGWPPVHGAEDKEIMTLPAGMRMDCYGGKKQNGRFHNYGLFVCDQGVPFEQRSLPAALKDNMQYHVYLVLKPIGNVKKGIIIPWFGQTGNGIQYELPGTIDAFINSGYLKQVR